MEENKKEMNATVRMSLRVARLHRKCVDEVVTSVGMHRAQHLMLLEIAHSGNTSRQVDFAERLGISTAAAAVTLRRLEEDGFIARKMSSSDKRSNETVLTKKGKAILDASCERYENIDRAMLDGISEEEMDTLMKCMEKMRQNLLSLRGEPDSKREEGLF